MANEKRNYVAVFPDGTEHPFELTGYGRRGGLFSAEVESALNNMLYNTSIRTSRKNPTPVEVRCFRLEIVGAQLSRTSVGSFRVIPPLERMTSEEFAEEEALLLAAAPEEFRSALSYKAYEDGHSAGHEEVLSILGSLLNWLEEPLAAYTARIRKDMEARLDAALTEAIKPN